MQTALNLLYMAGMLFIIGSLMMRSHTRRRQMALQDQQFQNQTRNGGNIVKAQSVVDQMEVRLYEYDREISARIDNKLMILDQLIEEAKQESERLEKLVQDLENKKAA